MAIDYIKENHIALVTINRPEAGNCLNPTDLEELGRVWLDFRDNDELLVAIVTGAGDKVFCAGADLKTLIPKMNSERSPVSPTIPAFVKNINCYKPIIAAVNGACIAAGMEILMGTDIRIATENAYFCVNEVKWGLFPGGGLTVRLPRQVPLCQAMEILLTGERYSAEEALRIGLINRIVPRSKLIDTCLSMASKICKNGPIATRKVKESILGTYNIPDEHAFIVEAFLGNQVLGTYDAKEGAKAFFEKRKPEFKGI